MARLPPVQLDQSDRVPVAPADFEPPPMDARVRRWTMPWEWWDAIGIYFTWLVLSGAVAFALAGVLDVETAVGLAGQVVVTLVALVLSTGVWIRLRGTAAGVPDALRRVLGVKRPTAQDLLRGVGWGVGAFVVIQLGLGLAITRVVEALGQDVPAVQQEVQEAVQGSGTGPLLLAFAIAVLAPLGEEVLFRGVLYQALAKHLPGWPAIGLSGLAFGLTHIEPFVIVLTFPLGMGLAWMMRRTGTLVVPIVAHATFNLIGLAVIRAGAGAGV